MLRRRKEGGWISISQHDERPSDYALHDEVFVERGQINASPTSTWLHWCALKSKDDKMKRAGSKKKRAGWCSGFGSEHELCLARLNNRDGVIAWIQWNIILYAVFYSTLNTYYALLCRGAWPASIRFLRIASHFYQPRVALEEHCVISSPHDCITLDICCWFA